MTGSEALKGARGPRMGVEAEVRAEPLTGMKSVQPARLPGWRYWVTERRWGAAVALKEPRMAAAAAGLAVVMVPMMLVVEGLVRRAKGARPKACASSAAAAVSCRSAAEVLSWTQMSWAGAQCWVSSGD